MRKALLVFETILIFVGILLSLWSSFPVKKIEKNLVNTVENQWEVSGNFTEGEKLVVEWAPPKWEGGVPFPDGNYAVYYITILAPPPEEGETNFTVKFYVSGKVNVTVSSSGSGLSDFSSDVVGGVARCSGTYVVHMDETAWIYYQGSSPDYIRLYREIVTAEYSHLGALPIGVALIVAGASLSTWAAKSSRRALRTRKKPSIHRIFVLKRLF